MHLGWQVENEHRQLRLTWAESGGPLVNAPSKTGYGTRLIQSTTTYSLGGKVEQNYEKDGLQAEIVIPLQNTTNAA